MKKIFLLLAGVFMIIEAMSQFESTKTYVGFAAKGAKVVIDEMQTSKVLFKNEPVTVIYNDGKNSQVLFSDSTFGLISNRQLAVFPVVDSPGRGPRAPKPDPGIGGPKPLPIPGGDPPKRFIIKQPMDAKRIMELLQANQVSLETISNKIYEAGNNNSGL